MPFVTISLPSASCSSCEMTSIEFRALLGGIGGGEGAETVQEGESDETGIFFGEEESTVGNSTSETTC